MSIRTMQIELEQWGQCAPGGVVRVRIWEIGG